MSGGEIKLPKPLTLKPNPSGHEPLALKPKPTYELRSWTWEVGNDLLLQPSYFQGFRVWGLEFYGFRVESLGV